MNTQEVQVTAYPEKRARRPYSRRKTGKISLLQQKVKKLKKLCKDFNPYVGPNPKEKKILLELGILEFDDPFRVTNQLLLLLEDSITELESDAQ